MTIGERILNTAKERGITQASLAKSLGIAQPSVYAWGKGAVPAADRILQIAEALSVDSAWLLSGAPNRHHTSSLHAGFQCRSIEEVAGKLGVPPAFLRAMVEGDIVPSNEFYERIFRDGLSMEPPPPDFYDKIDAGIEARKPGGSNEAAGYRDRVMALEMQREDDQKVIEAFEAENAELKTELARKNKMIDRMDGYLTLLEEKLAAASPVPCPAPYEESYSQSAG